MHVSFHIFVVLQLDVAKIRQILANEAAGASNALLIICHVLSITCHVPCAFYDMSCACAVYHVLCMCHVL